MRKRFYILYVFIFFIVGECIVRMDMIYDPLNNSPQKISIEVEESETRSQVENNKFVVSSSQYRVLVLGDSYINGGGVDPALKFSKVLKRRLQAEGDSNREILVLDVSRASNNTLDNYNTFLFYADRFQPDVVVLGYNFNDILGDLSIKEIVENNKEVAKSNAVVIAPPDRAVQNVPLLKRVTKWVYNFSELLEFSSTRIQKNLKLKGIVLPFGEFYYLTKQAYTPNGSGLQNTFEILDKMDSKCKELNSNFIVYKMPEFNLLEEKELFSMVDKELNLYFDKHPEIKYIDGNNEFDSDSGGLYMLSKHDGHPNELAHSEIVNGVISKIKN